MGLVLFQWYVLLVQVLLEPTDTYTITFTDTNTTTFNVYNGANGTGAGDMLTTTYDINGNGIVDNAEKS